MYSLEQIDDENQRRQAAMGNISASNDPQQQVHDGNEQLIKGAEVLGAGRTLGLTDDEAIDTKLSTLRREQRERRARRGKKISDPAVREDICRAPADALMKLILLMHRAKHPNQSSMSAVDWKKSTVRKI